MPRGNKNGSEPKPLGDGRYMARRRYTDAKGRTAEKKRIAYSYTEYLEARREIDKEIETELAGGPKKPRRDHTFADLVALYKKDHLAPAELAPNKEKIRGMRSYDNMLFPIADLEKYFGKFLL